MTIAAGFTLDYAASRVQTCPLRRAHQDRRSLQGASDSQRKVQDARRRQHRPAHTGGPAPRAGRGGVERRVGAGSAAQTTHGLRTAEMEQMRKLVRELRADTKRLVELV
jgi:hypothetical protein